MDQSNSQVSLHSVKTDIVTSTRVTKAEKKEKGAEKKDIENNEMKTETNKKKEKFSNKS